MTKQMHVAYLAGLIDGEGYLALLPSRVSGLKNQSFEPVIKIGMTGSTALEIMQLLQTKYGGHISTRNGLTKGGRLAYTIVIKSRKRVLRVLTDILPHLIVKKTQAELLQEFCLLPMTHSLHANFDNEILNRKIDLYKLLKDLKSPEPLAETN